MPYTINGIGTRYLGETNVQVRHDECEHCHRRVELKSYDTRIYFALLFVPVIPLSRKRVIDYCPSCTRHGVIPLDRYNALRSEALETTLREYRNDRQNSEKARAAIAASVHFRDEKAFQDIATELEQSPIGDVELLALLGHAYEEFQKLPEAETAYRAALNLADEPSLHEALALNLVRQRKPDEGWDHLGHILDNKELDKAPLLGLVAESYQEWGMHEEALTVLNEIEKTFPETADVPTFRKLRVISEKHRGTDTPVKSKSIGNLSQPVLTGKERTGKLARLVLPVLLLVGLGVYLFVAVSAGNSREIFIVNGLDRDYRVAVNGREYTLVTAQAARAIVPEGEVTVRVLDSELNIEDQAFTIETNLWTRPLDDSVFVINPDRAAVILWSEVIYVADHTKQSQREPREEFHTGRPLMRFKGIDYPFEQSPDQLKIESGDEAIRHELQQFRGDSVSQLAYAIAANVSREAAQHLLKLRFGYEPRSFELATSMMEYLSPAEFIDQVRPHLDHMPPDIELHRLYQVSVQLVRHDDGLVDEYRQRLEKHPDDSGLAYLLARIVPDFDEEETLYRRSATSDPPCAQAFGGLAYNELVRGDFEQAMTHASKAIELEPGIERLNEIYVETLHANARYATLDGLYQQRIAKDRDDLEAWIEHVYNLVCLGQTAEARQAVMACVGHVKSQDQLALAKLLEGAFESLIAYVGGEMDAWKSLASREPEPLPYLLSTGQGAKAWNTLASEKDNGDIDFLLPVYVVALATSDEQTASDALKRIGESRQPPETRKVVEMLRSEAKPDLDILLGCSVEPRQKSLLLTAAGLQFTEMRKPLFVLADKLNFDRRYPHDLIDRIVENRGFLEPLPE